MKERKTRTTASLLPFLTWLLLYLVVVRDQGLVRQVAAAAAVASFVDVVSVTTKASSSFRRLRKKSKKHQQHQPKQRQQQQQNQEPRLFDPDFSALFLHPPPHYHQRQQQQQRQHPQQTQNYQRHVTMSLRKTSSTPAPSTKLVTTTQLRGGSNMVPSPLFSMGPFWKAQTVLVGANALGFVISLVSPHTHYHVDLLGTGAFGLAAVPSLLQAATTTTTTQPLRITWSAASVIVWSTKLASFLLYRVIVKGGHDNRLDAILAEPSSCAGFWTFSVLWGILCSLPFTLGTTSSLPGSPVAIRAGQALVAAGFFTETVADYQKWVFKATHASSEFCNVGLWQLSQHPNWFGNLMLWSGIFLMNASALIEPSSTTTNAVNVKQQQQSLKAATQWLWRHRRIGVALLSPLFMSYLFYGQATGHILPDSLQSTHERYGYGVDPTYTNYIDSTSLVIPNPFRWLFGSRGGGSIKSE